jgi:hypothetical protein
VKSSVKLKDEALKWIIKYTDDIDSAAGVACFAVNLMKYFKKKNQDFYKNHETDPSLSAQNHPGVARKRKQQDMRTELQLLLNGTKYHAGLYDMLISAHHITTRNSGGKNHSDDAQKDQSSDATLAVPSICPSENIVVNADIDDAQKHQWLGNSTSVSPVIPQNNIPVEAEDADDAQKDQSCYDTLLPPICPTENQDVNADVVPNVSVPPVFPNAKHSIESDKTRMDLSGVGETRMDLSGVGDTSAVPPVIPNAKYSIESDDYQKDPSGIGDTSAVPPVVPCGRNETDSAQKDQSVVPPVVPNA